MEDYKKVWQFNNTYNFSVEFNRIESYNQYVETWLKNYYKVDFGNYIFQHKTDWNINDIVDVKDYNRVKNNINKLLELIDSINLLSVSEQINQVWNVNKANEIEIALNEYLSYLGSLQFSTNICGLTICGNNQRLVGG